MNNIGLGNIILGVGTLVSAYASWWQYKRYKALGTVPQQLIRFQRNITATFLLIALVNLILALWFHP